MITAFSRIWFLALSVALGSDALSPLAVTQATETPEEHGAVCDGRADDSLALRATLDASARAMRHVTVPASCTLKIHGAMTLPPGTQLVLDGKLIGAGGELIAAGDVALSGVGSVATSDDGSGHVFGIALQEGRVTVSGVSFVGDPLRPMNEAIRVAPKAAGITTLDIHDVYFTQVQFGILRDSATAAHTVQFADLHHNHFFDLGGDAIEWNVGYGDGELSISGNMIDLLHATLQAQGIAIGVAGEGPYADPPAHPQRHVFITGNTVKRVRQALHCEVCVGAVIDGNRISEIDPRYGSKTIDVAAVQLVGSYNSSVSGNYISESGQYGQILLMTGVTGGRFVPSEGQNIIAGNQMLNSAGISDICARSPESHGEPPPETIIQDNVIVNGTIHHAGACNYTLSGNTVLAPMGQNGLMLDFNSVLLEHGLPGKLVIDLQRNTVRDRNGGATVEIKPPSPGTNLFFSGTGNNFAVPMTTRDSPSTKKQ